MTIKWWGYLHANGSIQVKRFFSQQDIDEANDTRNHCVQRVLGPFDADNREDAKMIVQKALLG